MSFLLQHLFPSLTWKMPGREKKLFLTFDDGPIPEVTPWVIDTLQRYNACATFFCVGENAERNPGILKLIRDSGHSIGNHTMNHLNGWKTPNQKYYSDIYECRKHVASELFRPPYGKIKYRQANFLKNEFRIIMWDVLSMDYNISLTGQQCFETVKKKAVSGSIIVFHDSLKAEKRMRVALPETLNYFSDQGYTFAAIE